MTPQTPEMTMRGISLAFMSLLIGGLALAAPPRIDLDRPGVLDRLKLEHPQRYQAVSAILIAAQRAPCRSDEIKLLQARLNVRDLECDMVVSTRYPALRRVAFELDSVAYAATVELDVGESFQPASNSSDFTYAH